MGVEEGDGACGLSRGSGGNSLGEQLAENIKALGNRAASVWCDPFIFVPCVEQKPVSVDTKLEFEVISRNNGA